MNEVTIDAIAPKAYMNTEAMSNLYKNMEEVAKGELILYYIPVEHFVEGGIGFIKVELLTD